MGERNRPVLEPSKRRKESSQFSFRKYAYTHTHTRHRRINREGERRGDENAIASRYRSHRVAGEEQFVLDVRALYTHTRTHTRMHTFEAKRMTQTSLSLLYPRMKPMIRIGPERYGRGDGDGSSSAEQTEPGLHDLGGRTRLPPGTATRVAYPESWSGGTRRNRHVRHPPSACGRRRQPGESREELQRPTPRPPR